MKLTEAIMFVLVSLLFAALGITFHVMGLSHGNAVWSVPGLCYETALAVALLLLGTLVTGRRLQDVPGRVLIALCLALLLFLIVAAVLNSLLVWSSREWLTNTLEGLAFFAIVCILCLAGKMAASKVNQETKNESAQPTSAGDVATRAAPEK